MDFKAQLKKDLAQLIQKNDTCTAVSRQLQQLREDKQELEHKVLDFLKRSNVQNKVFMLNEHTITQKSAWQYQQLSMKYVESCLHQYCGENNNEFDVKEFMEFMRRQRDKKQKDELKISLT